MIGFLKYQKKQSGKLIVFDKKIRYFLSVNNHNKVLTHNIFLPMYHLYYFWILIIWNYKLHCSKVFINISKNMVVNQWYLIQLEQYLWSENHHNKNSTHNILFPLFHSYLFHILIVRSHELHCLIEFCNNKRIPIGDWICFNFTKTVFLIHS